MNSTDTLEQYTLNATKLSEEQAKWDQNRTGVLVIPYTNQLGFFRLADLEGEDDPTAGSNSGHFELLFSVSHIRVFLWFSLDKVSLSRTVLDLEPL